MTIAIGALMIMLQVGVYAYLIMAERRISKWLGSYSRIFEVIEDEDIAERYLNDKDISRDNSANQDS